MKKEKTEINIEEILRKIRKYEIRLRKSLYGTVSGEILSLSKGTGLEFDDVRQYQYGDDVRVIDWNVSAKGSGTYIKTFKEEKDQTVFILFDLSASTLINNQQKADKIKELASVLYLSALNQGSSAAFIGFSDKLELVSKISKSKTKAFSNIVRILKAQSSSKKTDLGRCLIASSRMLNKRSLIFVISDFIDEYYEKSTKIIANKHELIFLRVVSKDEEKNLPLGIVPTRNSETGTLSFFIKSVFGDYGLNKHKILERENRYQNLVRNSSVDALDIETDEDFTDKLVQFFKKRKVKR